MVTKRKSKKSKPRQDERATKAQFFEHLLRSFRETDLAATVRRSSGLGPRATKQAVRAVHQKWLDSSKLAPAEALRTRELLDVDQMIHTLLYDEDGHEKDKIIESEWHSIVKLLQLRDKLTERLLKHEEELKGGGGSGYMGIDESVLDGARDLRGKE